MNDKYVVIDRQCEHHLQPSSAVTAANRPILSAACLPVFAAAHHLLAFRHAHTMLGGIIQGSIRPSEIRSVSCLRIIHT